MNSDKLSIIFVIGAPGSGKGTLCKRLSEEHGFGHVSIGDLLRSIASSPCTDTTVINSVKNADLLPVEALAPILEARIDKEKRNGQKKILIDGFPRMLDQAEPIEALIGSPVFVLFFKCPEKTTEQRFLTRNLAGRESDNISVFRKRYEEFERLNSDIVKEYRTRGILLEVDTSQETEVSYKSLLNTLKHAGVVGP